STQNILAVTMAGTGGVATSGVGISGAGAGSGNYTYTTTTATIGLGSSVTTYNAADVTLTATDDSTIPADGGGLALAGAGGANGGLAASVGAAAAVNEINNNVFAKIVGATVTSAGAVGLKATSSESITAITVGIAGSLAGGSGGGIALGGAGSGSGNTINDDTEALIIDGTAANGSTVRSNVTSGKTNDPNSPADKDVT